TRRRSGDPGRRDRRDQHRAGARAARARAARHLRGLGDLCGRGSEVRCPAAARRLHRRSGMSTRPPITLSIAGTDPSGGAGIHADLKTFTARGTLGTTVITALVVQNTHGVSRVYPIDVDFVADQFDSVLDDMPVDASKSGMLGTRDRKSTRLN